MSSLNFSKLSLENTSPTKVYYMLGRFQPFTMGHLALFNSMVEEASYEEGQHAYLFVSHKKPNFSRAKVLNRRNIGGVKTHSKKVKPLMKKIKVWIILSTQVGYQIVNMIMKAVYKPKLPKSEGKKFYVIRFWM